MRPPKGSVSVHSDAPQHPMHLPCLPLLVGPGLAPSGGSARHAASAGHHDVTCTGWAACAGTDVIILSGGDDGYVRGWRLSDVLQRMQARAPRGIGGAAGVAAQRPRQDGQHHKQPSAPEGSAPGPSPCLAVRLPRAESTLAASSLPPAVQALTVGSGAGSSLQVFAGEPSWSIPTAALVLAEAQ